MVDKTTQPLLKAFGVMKAESKRRKWGNLNARQEGTYLPTDYKSKKTVDQVIAEGNRLSDESITNDGRSDRTTIAGKPPEDYEDIDEVQRQRDARYLAGQPGGQKVGRRSSNIGHKYGTADSGPSQRYMDVGRTGAAAKEPNRGVRTSQERVTPGRRTQVVRSEAHRKKELAALSPEERKKSPFQRLKEADTKHLMAVEKLYKAFGIMKAERGEKKRQTYESRDNMLRIKRRQLNRGAPEYEGKTLADLDDHERKIQQALGNHDWEPPAHGETPQVTRSLNVVEADWDKKRRAAERIGDRSWSRLPLPKRREE
jgi:hypothetical protein